MLTSDLITSIQRRAAIPSTQVTFSTTDFYNLMDEEIESKLVPLIIKNMEEYYVYDYPYNITAGVNAYMIPTRAIAQGLRDVQVISSTDPESIVPLDRLDITNLFSSTSSSYRVQIKKNGFYVKNNNVVMYPGPTVTQNIINLEYYMRPNTCVDPSTCGVITAIGTNTLFLSSVPANITTATLVDYVKVSPGFECTAIDQTISTIVGTTLTMASPIPSSVSVGDYVCPATTTCIVQVPKELLPLLSQYVTVRILSSQGDLQATQQAIAELAKLEENAQMMIAPRIMGKPKRVSNSRGISRFV